MPRWTKEQEEAINKEGCNIIVSAGAGSGKTAVLTQRVIRKLKDGVNINEILVLTFTNAAAYEMKERIRKAIKKEEELKPQLDLLDGAYITTFDSFSLAIVRKYHYLLNISKNVSIIDSSIIYNEKVKILDDIMMKNYQEKDIDFLKLIKDFCVKDDLEIKKALIEINDKMDLLMDKKTYLDTYLDKFYDDSFIDNNINSYMKIINDKFLKIKDLTEDLLSLAENNYYDKILSLSEKMNQALSYEDIYEIINSSVPSLPPRSSEEIKMAKERLSTAINNLQNYMELPTLKEVKETVLMTEPYSRIIVKIIKELDERLMDFKYQNNAFEFNDIAHMAIGVVKNNQDVLKELKYFFKEIMIDEYQDTSYLQESFINLIANDDVYMVGDIKQSIYRFRNADPYIFKNKYDCYSQNDGGYKIDLLKNFRSRGEVLNNINLLFDAVMDDEIGGAAYQVSHRMIFGNNAYLESGKTNQNYDMEIYNYQYDKSLGFSKDEIEIFTIVKDIKEKVEAHYQIFDKDANLLRDVTYNDFCILLDRSSKFDLYKKIFEYFNVPLTKYTSTNIKNDDDILLIKNILSLLIDLNEKNYGVDFQYNFVSIGRSYLFRYSDEDLFDYIKKGNYRDSSLYKLLEDINNEINYLALSQVIELIIERFSFYVKSITVGDMEKVNVRCEYIINLASNMEKMGFGVLEFRDYLDNLIASDIKMECEISENISDSVKIMTIHKSKGLEYHICYFAGFSYDFNISDMKKRFTFSNQYGIIAPYFKEGIGDIFYKAMFKEEYLKDEISEKIRLFYVALTRCKEKMILVCNLQEETKEFTSLVDKDIRMQYKSFLDIMNSISSILQPYIKNIELDSLKLTHDYNLIKKTNYRDKIEPSLEKINNISLDIATDKKMSKHFSKSNDIILDKKTKDKMNFGTKMHYLFEIFDFQNPDYSLILEEYRPYLEKFLHCGLSFDGKIYKEYEFIYEDNDTINHGIIDFMIEYDDKIIIVDYKLKNTNDEKYIEQLNGYKNYIHNKTKKDVDIYLYSIVNGTLNKIMGKIPVSS